MNRVDHPRNLAIKFVVLGFLIYVTIPLVGTAPSGDRWIIAIVTAIISYLLGDLLVLPRLGPDWSAVVDAALIGASVWIVAGLLVTPTLTLGASLLIGGLAGVAEWLFHHLLRQTAPDPAALRKSAQNPDPSKD